MNIHEEYYLEEDILMDFTKLLKPKKELKLKESQKL
jgi:hypothetical protein